LILGLFDTDLVYVLIQAYMPQNRPPVLS